MTPISIRATLRLALVGAVALLFCAPLKAQPPYCKDEKKAKRYDALIKSILRDPDRMRFSDIEVFDIYGSEENSRMLALLRQPLEDQCKPKCDELAGAVGGNFSASCGEVVRSAFSAARIRSAAAASKQQKKTVVERVCGSAGGDCDLEDDESVEEIYKIAADVLQCGSALDNFPTGFYLVTSPENDDLDADSRNSPKGPTVIGLIAYRKDPKTQQVTFIPEYIMSGCELYGKKLCANPGGGECDIYYTLKRNAKEMIDATHGQSSVAIPIYKNITSSLRRFTAPDLARRSPVRVSRISELQYAYVVRSIDEGRPIRSRLPDTANGDAPFDPNQIDRTGRFGKAQVAGLEHPNEVYVGFDGMITAGYHSYALREDPTQETYDNVPRMQWGVELSNGVDQINYPSVWGGRMNLDLLLENVRLGLIMPQIRFNGRSPAENSSLAGIFDAAPQPILGGWGLSFAGDFAAPALMNSAQFNIFGSYNFSVQGSDALRETIYRPDPANLNNPFALAQAGDVAYFIRYVAQAYYSIAFSADQDNTNLFTVKVGGTAYGVDGAQRRVTEDQQRTALANGDSSALAPSIILNDAMQSVGGLSAKLSYMKSGGRFPYGFHMQYFDESILAGAWLQFLVSPSWDLKLETKYYTPVLRTAHAWEPGSLFIPSVSVIHHFGTP